MYIKNIQNVQIIPEKRYLVTVLGAKNSAPVNVGAEGLKELTRLYGWNNIVRVAEV